MSRKKFPTTLHTSRDEGSHKDSPRTGLPSPHPKSRTQHDHRPVRSQMRQFRIRLFRDPNGLAAQLSRPLAFAHALHVMRLGARVQHAAAAARAALFLGREVIAVDGDGPHCSVATCTRAYLGRVPIAFDVHRSTQAAQLHVQSGCIQPTRLRAYSENGASLYTRMLGLVFPCPATSQTHTATPCAQEKALWL